MKSEIENFSDLYSYIGKASNVGDPKKHKFSLSSNFLRRDNFSLGITRNQDKIKVLFVDNISEISSEIDPNIGAYYTYHISFPFEIPEDADKYVEDIFMKIDEFRNK